MLCLLLLFLLFQENYKYEILSSHSFIYLKYIGRIIKFVNTFVKKVSKNVNNLVYTFDKLTLTIIISQIYIFIFTLSLIFIFKCKNTPFL